MNAQACVNERVIRRPPQNRNVSRPGNSRVVQRPAQNRVIARTNDAHS